MNSTTINGGDAAILDNGAISVEGSLIAVGGTVGGFSNNSKGGSAIVGTGR